MKATENRAYFASMCMATDAMSSFYVAPGQYATNLLNGGDSELAKFNSRFTRINCRQGDSIILNSQDIAIDNVTV